MLLVAAVSPYPPHLCVHNYDNHELGQTPIGNNHKLGQPRGIAPTKYVIKHTGQRLLLQESPLTELIPLAA